MKPTRPVDERRIYLSGTSPGGYGTRAWGPHDLPHFAAIAPIVGGTGREGAKAMTPDCAPWDAGRAKIPVDALVGAPDTTAPPDRSERMIAAIPKAGGKEAKLEFDPEEGQGAGRGRCRSGILRLDIRPEARRVTSTRGVHNRPWHHAQPTLRNCPPSPECVGAPPPSTVAISSAELA